ncbi:DUF421 domain-containing protein [Bizionia psychrotolerans]|uniref:DUF421 domain-containing protein n=1 Tax=Bizionia psychrotolerans TaxID=1492901 RepID=UPI0006500A0F|nr:YetF domain-containing protein [Bizionia psychrotolerans]
MDWIYKIDDPILITFLASFLIFIVVIVLTRIVGLRSFAKFTAYDFAFTVAIGSIISSTLTSSTTVAHGSMAIASLLILTFIFSFLQRRFPALDQAISNKPLLLMKGNQILDANLKHSRIQKSQLIAKLREANVTNFNQVLAVVLEATGDISVLHKANSDSAELDSEILNGVRETP